VKRTRKNETGTGDHFPKRKLKKKKACGPNWGPKQESIKKPEGRTHCSHIESFRIKEKKERTAGKKKRPSGRRHSGLHEDQQGNGDHMRPPQRNEVEKRQRQGKTGDKEITRAQRRSKQKGGRRSEWALGPLVFGGGGGTEGRRQRRVL